jgi:hypothetical protein
MLFHAAVINSFEFMYDLFMWDLFMWDLFMWDLFMWDLFYIILKYNFSKNKNNIYAKDTC